VVATSRGRGQDLFDGGSRGDTLDPAIEDHEIERNTLKRKLGLSRRDA